MSVHELACGPENRESMSPQICLSMSEGYSITWCRDRRGRGLAQKARERNKSGKMEERSKCESLSCWVDKNSTYASTAMSAGRRIADELTTGVEAEDLFFRWARGELLSGGEVGGGSRGRRIATCALALSSESICAASSS